MAPQTCSPAPEPMTLEAFRRDVQRRVARVGGNAIPRNSGLRRTEGKQRLLAAIADTGAEW